MREEVATREDSCPPVEFLVVLRDLEALDDVADPDDLVHCHGRAFTSAMGRTLGQLPGGGNPVPSAQLSPRSDDKRRAMFDGNDKALLFLGLMVAGFITLAAESRAPDPGGAVALDVALLPALPLGDPVGGVPMQTEVRAQTVALTDGFYATLHHGYVLEGEVVTRRRFRGGGVSTVSPLDLGIVWGDLDTAGLEFRAGHRVMWTRYSADTVLPADWETQITNNHLVPASNEVRAALMALEVGQRVRIEGYLVNVTGERINPWRSSTRRDDSTFVGGCEIILVTGVGVLPPERAV